MPNEQFFSYIMSKTNNIEWDDNVGFVLDQCSWLEFYSATSLKQHSDVLS